MHAAAVVVLLAGAATMSAVEAADGPRGFRALAPGVLTVIPADAALDDAIQRGSLVEVTQGQQSLAWVPKRAAPNTTFVVQLRDAERTAKAAGLGLWGACGGPGVPASATSTTGPPSSTGPPNSPAPAPR